MMVEALNTNRKNATNGHPPLQLSCVKNTKTKHKWTFMIWEVGNPNFGLWEIMS